MKENMENLGRQLKFLALLLCLLVVVGAVVALKTASNRPALPVGDEADDSTAVSAPVPAPAADVPAYDVEYDVPAPPVRPDSVVQKDPRKPADAGYEDGYNMGVDDAKTHVYKANYDESSEFPSVKDQADYALAYRKGYDAGYAAEHARQKAPEPASAGE